MRRLVLLCLFLAATLLPGSPAASGQEAPEGTLVTRWAKDVTAERVHPEYPRPQMARKDWVNLNGSWQYAIRPRDEKLPEKLDGTILVPFPVESTLSGVKKYVRLANRLWYRRTFKAPALPSGGRLLLHFGAVDWHAIVWVNGQKLGEHKGGYDAFTFDITEALRKDGDQEIVVSVWDPSDKGFQPRGKQVTNPQGIWYTPVTGIWQTVWLEPVPAASIAGLKMTPDVDQGVLRLSVQGRGTQKGETIRAEATDGDRVVATAAGRIGETVELKVAGAKLWSPDSPFLYGLKVRLEKDGKAVDEVASYFGMRKIAVAKDTDGFNRLFLNNKPLFQLGPLDQGWWPDGLYTAPTDAALRYDLEMTRKLGFNMIRKHVKVEPDRWYYHCDRLGILVWQDMPNGDRHIAPRAPDIVRSAESADNFRREYTALIDGRYNHPCIVVWVPFNEGWGQFETDRVLAWTKEYDPTRLVDGPSGWTDRGTGDMQDMHSYPGPAMPRPEPRRAVVLGEFGGLGLPLEGHLWWNKRNWGYRTYKTREELQASYTQLIARLRPLISEGLAAAVYTQTTDVEGEVNGLMTYDRAVIKFDVDRLARMHQRLYGPPPIFVRTTIVPTSEEQGQEWRYTTSAPPEGWAKPDFDDTSWSKGPGGFGTRGTPDAVVRTEWNGKEIWLRRTFELKDAELKDLSWRLHHDEDIEVYLNGERVLRLEGYTTQYLNLEMSDQGQKALRRGKNTLAVRCKQTGGGQYIDVGLVQVTEKPRQGK
jgi:hypothetical protein